MTDVADLRIRVQSDSVPQAESRLKGLADAGGKAERATDGLVGTIGKFASVTAIAAGVVAGLNKVVAAQRQFDVLNAGLVTATGSAEGATVAFEALTEFAQKTPYSLDQAVEGFTKLVNLGLTPSERALTSYGNTASAMGKDLSQMIEAVADASTGEFERLKEFGIKAKQQGDQVQLTFQGVKTTVANEAGAIEDYLIKLGENQFAGAMERRMDTLDGALSNLGDTWDAVFRNIGDSGVGDTIAAGVNVAIDALDALNEWLQSGQLEGAIDATAAKWGPWADDAKEAAGIVWDAIQSFADWLNDTYPQDMEILSSAWNDFPENVRAIVQLATVHVAWFVEEVRLSMEAAKGYIDAIRDGWGGSQLKDVFAAAQAASDRNKANLEDSIDLTFQELQATKDSAKAATAAAIEKAAAAKKERDARRAANAGKDRLAGFGTDRPAASAGGKAKKPKADRSGEREQRDFDGLVDDLRTEEEALQVSYDKRRAIIEKHNGIEASMRQDLMRRLDDWRNGEADKITASKQREFEQVRQSLMTEEEAIQASYDKRKKIILDAQGITDAARAQALARLDKEKADDLARQEQEQQSRRDRLMEASMSELEIFRAQRDQEIAEQKAGLDAKLINEEDYQKNVAAIKKKYQDAEKAAQLDQQAYTYNMYSSMFGALGQLTSQFAQGQGKSAERMFKISKALNYAQAVMSIAAGIANAQKMEYPMNIVEGIRVAAVGAAQIASISSQRFSGAYDKGGNIPAGSFGVVGERGMEIVQGPANVTGREDTARLLRKAAEGGGGDVNNTSVTIQVVLGENGAASSNTTTSTDGMDAEQAKKFGQLIDLRVRDVILREQRQGGMLSSNR